MPIDHFFKELSDVKDLFEWKVDGQRIRGVLKDNRPWWKRIRSHSTFTACPITAIFYYRTGEIHHVSDVFLCGKRMNLDAMLISKIQTAADRNFKNCVEQPTRNRILEVLEL